MPRPPCLTCRWRSCCLLRRSGLFRSADGVRSSRASRLGVLRREAGGSSGRVSEENLRAEWSCARSSRPGASRGPSHPAPVPVRQGVDRRARRLGRPVAHVAAELGVSRQTAYRWRNRYREGGVDALFDLSSRPHASINPATPDRAVAVLTARAELRQGPLRLPARTMRSWAASSPRFERGSPAASA